MDKDTAQTGAKPIAFDYGWRIFWLALSLFLVVMLPYVIFISKQDQNNLESKGKLAVGVVTEIKCKTMFGDGGRQSCRPVIQFQASDGSLRTYTETTPQNVVVGQQVNVIHTINPFDAQMATEAAKSYNVFTYIVLGIMVLIFGGISFVCIKSLYQMRKGTWRGVS